MKKSPVKPKPAEAIRKADKILRECSADARFAKVVEAFNNSHNCPHCAILAALTERASAVVAD